MENSIESHFKEFYENIKLTSAQKQDANDKYTGVCKKLHDSYYPSVSYAGNTKLLIGSYGKNTSIRPARDVDVIFIMPREKFAQYDDNSSNKQSQLLQDIKDILETKYPNTPIKAFGKIVKLEFSETRHNIELVPAWENDDGSFTIANSENGGSWEYQNYREEINSILDSESKTGKTKYLIRMIKKWSGNCSVNIGSFQIEQMAISFLSSRDYSQYVTSALVKAFFVYFIQKSTDQNTTSHLKTALSRAEKACEYENSSKYSSAIDEWIKIFGSDYPKGIDTVAAKTTLIDLQKQYPSTREEFLDHTYGIAFAIESQNIVSMDADISKQNGFRDALLSAFLRKKYPVQKRKKLLFRISHNVSGPYKVKWKIRNYGEEAKMADALRGEIYDDNGSETREERASYHGEHYVECYIIKNNKCVAMGKILVPIGNNY